MENKTPNPTKSIEAAFDSVNLINKLIVETIDDKKKNAVKRNVEHLKHMLTKDFFSQALTANQKTDIDTCIAAGENYIK